MAQFPPRDVLRRLSDQPGAGFGGPDLPGPAAFDAVTLAAEVDDRCRAYIADVRQDFQDIRHALAQLAGLLLLEQMGGAGASVVDHPMLVAAREEVALASDNLKSRRPPPAARHHHHHLLRAAGLVCAVVEWAPARLRRDGKEAATRLAAALRTAWDELRHAENALPGFETVNFGQSCCAMHRAMMRACTATRNE